MSEWWRGAVIYQIYPRSFQDTDGDGVGDLPGITRRLDHVARLGADAVWLSPVFPSPMEDMGYDVSDYCGIDPIFGSLDDFDAMLERAHGLGLKVMLDQVLSHSSSAHVWFRESRSSRDDPKADWYVWANGLPDGTPPTNWLSLFGGPAWEWDTQRRQYYLHHFLRSQPDLNYHNPEVQDAMLDSMRFWLERGVDGFRLDTANFYFHDEKLRDDPADPALLGVDWAKPYDAQYHFFSKTRPENIQFLERMRALMDEYGDRALLGEIVEGKRSTSIMADYTRGDGRLHMAYSFEMLGPAFSAAHIRSRVAGFFDEAPDGWPVWAFSNHDVTRHASRWSHQGDVARLAATLLLTLPGSVCLYQGEELGQTQTDLEFHELTDPEGRQFWPVMKGRDGCRTPMVWDGSASHGGFTEGEPWLPVKPPQAARSVASQEGEPGSVLEHYRAMLALRRSRPELRHGGIHFLEAPEPVLAFVRRKGEEATLCIFNMSAEARPVQVIGAVDLAEPAGAVLEGDELHLEPNGFALMRPTQRDVRVVAD
ncbi:alpha-glucosidase [Roseitranquillus sediminis]|uniref:alpha-glucosidase n=1 Tax=Roseitranquillus sediminis TaxID=2809051 RepID=UPI001D0CCF76|nr:alpha-glucosidase [Roseitranquillus sediminis]MBM9595881.1 alpha glucosidase [Roseitranquillus sediminis]